MADKDDPKRWRLETIVKTVDYDPHLEEQKLAAKAGRANPVITSKGADNRDYTDVIVRLGDTRKIPKELQLSRHPGEGDIVTGKVALDDVETVRRQVRSLKAATELQLDLYHSVPAIRCDPASLQGALQLSGIDGSGVVIGVVDVGCDFKHPSFIRSSGKTRLLSLWDQSDPPAGGPGHRPEGFGYGRELTADEINAALLQSDPYSALGYTPAFAAHGTHVLDIAAGNGRGLNQLGGIPEDGLEQPAPRGVAPGADLIFVHLKTDETQFLGNSRHLLEAVEYIFTKAHGRPTVVNLSLSTSGGPHDGTTLVEQGLEHLLREPGRAIVVSAGNAFAKETHAEGLVPGGNWQELLWEVDPRGEKNEMEVWYAGAQSLQLILVRPDGTELGPVTLGQTAEVLHGNEPWGRISHRKHDPNNGDNQIDIRLASPEGEVLEGVWTVKLGADPGRNVAYHAWIEQDDQGAGRFRSPTNTACTLGSICCAEKLLTVGAIDTSTRAYLHEPYEATAAGPTRQGGFKPDVGAPGENILAARARGGTAIFSGTSMAAPHVTGLVALLFQVAQGSGLGLLPIEETRRVILDSAQRISDSDWHSRLGRGLIDGSAALKLLTQKKRTSDTTQPAVPESVQETAAAGRLSAAPEEWVQQLRQELRQLAGPIKPDKQAQQLDKQIQQLTKAIKLLEVRLAQDSNGKNGHQKREGKTVHPGVLKAHAKSGRRRSKADRP